MLCRWHLCPLFSVLIIQQCDSSIDHAGPMVNDNNCESGSFHGMSISELFPQVTKYATPTLLSHVALPILSVSTTPTLLLALVQPSNCLHLRSFLDPFLYFILRYFVQNYHTSYRTCLFLIRLEEYHYLSGSRTSARCDKVIMLSSKRFSSTSLLSKISLSSF